MYTKTGFGLLAAAGVAVGVVGMTMGGASSAPSTACAPANADSSAASGAARTASTSPPNGSLGPVGPQGIDGADGADGTNGNGSNGNGNGSNGNGNGNGSGGTGGTGSTGAPGVGGLNINVDADHSDDTTGSATVTNRQRNGTQAQLLEVRARSNAANTGTIGPDTKVTGRSSLTGPRPFITVNPGR